MIEEKQGFKINNWERTSSYQITSDVNPGSFVELLVDGRFFGRDEGQQERYAGYVASLTDKVIGLSVTHHQNKSHGYNDRKSEHPQRNVVEISVSKIHNYRVL